MGLVLKSQSCGKEVGKLFEETTGRWDRKVKEARDSGNPLFCGRLIAFFKECSAFCQQGMRNNRKSMWFCTWSYFEMWHKWRMRPIFTIVSLAFTVCSSIMHNRKVQWRGYKINDVLQRFSCRLKKCTTLEKYDCFLFF